MNVKVRNLIAGIGWVFTSLGLAQVSQLKSVDASLHFVAIFADGTAKMEADSAVVSLVHKVEAASLSEAINKGATAKREILKTLKEGGIGESDIVFRNFSSNPQRGKLTNKIRRYEVSSPISVTVKNEGQFAKIAIAVDANPQLDYLSRKPQVTDPTSVQLKAAADAITNLKKKVAQYESLLNVKLEMVSFSEQASNLRQSTGNSSFGNFPLTSGLRSGTFSAAGSIDALLQGEANFGEQVSSVQVRAIYKILKPSDS